MTGNCVSGCGIIGQSSFLSTAEILSGGGQKRESCVDYPIDVLLYENVPSIRVIIEIKVVHVATKIVLDKKITAVMEYIKLVYSSNIVTDNDLFHYLEFSLSTKCN